MAWTAIPGVIFTYLVVPLILFGLAVRLARATGPTVPRLAMLCFGLGPIAVSRLLTLQIHLLPGQNDAFYLAGVGGSFLLLAIAAWPGLASLLAARINAPPSPAPRWFDQARPLLIQILANLLFLVCLYLLGQAIVDYLVDHDAKTWWKEFKKQHDLTQYGLNMEGEQLVFGTLIVVVGTFVLVCRLLYCQILNRFLRGSRLGCAGEFFDHLLVMILTTHLVMTLSLVFYAWGWFEDIESYLAAILLTGLLFAGYQGWTARWIPHTPSAVSQRFQVVTPALVFNALTLLLFAEVILLIVGLLPFENDAVQYLYVAQQMYEQKSFAFYPVLSALPDKGFYAPSSHPLGYYGMLVWSYLLQGSAEGAGVAKLVAPFHVGYLLLLVRWLLAPYGRLTQALGMVLTLSSPVFFEQILQLGIDSQRVALMTVTVCWLVEARRQNTPAFWMMAGAVAGLNLYSHSLNGLITGLLLGAFLLQSAWRAPRRPYASWGAMILLALAVGGDRYLSNLLQFGTPLYDSQPIYTMVPAIDQATLVNQAKGYPTGTERLLRSWQSLFQARLLEGFGVNFWFAALGVLVALRRFLQSETLRLGGLLCLLFFGFMGSYYLLVNASILYLPGFRYMMTIHPWIAMMGAIGLGTLFAKAQPRLGLLAALLLGFALAVPILLQAYFWRPVLDWSTTSPTRFAQLERGPDRVWAERIPEVLALRFIRTHTPDQARFLLMHQNLFVYYANRRSIRDSDPRMADVYLASSPSAALAALKQLGVNYLYLPPWPKGTLDHSWLPTILRDRQLARLAFFHLNYRIYQLRD